MNTKALVTFIQKEAKDWSRSDILTVINEIQRMVFTQRPVSSMRVIETTTGKDPVLTTTALDYSYDIDITNGFTYDAAFVTSVYDSDPDSPIDTQLLVATPADPAKVIFKSDPGDQDYYLQFYKLPPSITSESVNLAIPHAFHLTHVVEGVMGYIEKAKSGKSERWEMFRTRLLQEVIHGVDPLKYISIKYKGY